MNSFVRLTSAVLIGALSLMVGLSSCQSDVEDPLEKDTVKSLATSSEEDVFSLPASELKDLVAGYDPALRSASETASSAVKAAVAEVSAKLFSMLADKVDLADGEFASYVLCHDKTAGKIWVESVDIYSFRVFGDQHPFFLGMYLALSEDTDGYAKFLSGKLDEWDSGIRSAARDEKIRIQVSCDEGTHDGESFQDDLPRSKSGWRKFAKRHEQFLYDCLEGGGCVKVCRVSGSFAPSV